MNLIQILVLSLIGVVNTLWTLPFIFSYIFGYSLNYITDTEKINKLLLNFKNNKFFS